MTEQFSVPEQTQQVAVRDKEIRDERLIHYYDKTEKKVYVQTHLSKTRKSKEVLRQIAIKQQIPTEQIISLKMKQKKKVKHFK